MKQAIRVAAFFSAIHEALLNITELWHCLGIVIVQARARGGQGGALWAGVANKTGALVDIVFCARPSVTGNTYRTGNTA